LRFQIERGRIDARATRRRARARRGLTTTPGRVHRSVSLRTRVVVVSRVVALSRTDFFRTTSVDALFRRSQSSFAASAENPPREGVSSRAGASPREARPDPSPPRLASLLSRGSARPLPRRLASLVSRGSAYVAGGGRKPPPKPLRRRFAGTCAPPRIVPRRIRPRRAARAARRVFPPSALARRDLGGERSAHLGGALRVLLQVLLLGTVGVRRVVPRRTAALGPRRRRRRRGASATTRLGRMPRRAVPPRAASRPRTGARRPGNLSRRGGRSALRSSGFVARGALFSRHVTTLSLGPRETRATTRRNCDGVRQTRARVAARARLAPAPRRALTPRRRARDAPSVFRLRRPARSFRTRPASRRATVVFLGPRETLGFVARKRVAPRVATPRRGRARARQRPLGPARPRAARGRARREARRREDPRARVTRRGFFGGFSAFAASDALRSSLGRRVRV